MLPGIYEQILLQLMGQNGVPQFFGPRQGGYNVPNPFQHSGTYGTPLTQSRGGGFAGGMEGTPQKIGTPQRGGYNVPYPWGYSPHQTTPLTYQPGRQPRRAAGQDSPLQWYRNQPEGPSKRGTPTSAWAGIGGM